MRIMKNISVLYHLLILSFLTFVPFQIKVYAQYEGCSSNHQCGSAGRYTLSNQKWSYSDLTYYFINETDDITGSQEELAFEAAFNAWSSASLLTFTEASIQSEADIKIEFADWTTWCSAMGETDYYACSYFPEESCSGIILVNDERWTWSLNSNPPSGQKDLYAAAIHEVGHALGLCHSSNSNAVMDNDLVAGKRTLHDDDEDGINALYPPQEITFKNNFTGGSIYVEDLVNSVTAPVIRSYIKYDAVNLKADSPQNSDSYERRWHTGTTNTSNWERVPDVGVPTSLSSNIQYTYTVDEDDDNTEIIANLRKVCDDITFQNNLPGYGNGGVIKVNSIQVNSPSTDNTVVELNEITGEPVSQLINGIYYTFEDWSTGDTIYAMTFYPDSNTTYTANYNTKPSNSYRSLDFNDGDIGKNIELSWNSHPLDNDGITKYDIYRKTKVNGIMGSESKIGTRTANGSATYTFTDTDYQVADGTTNINCFYDVRAYYLPSTTHADPQYESIYADCLANYENYNAGNDTDARDAIMAEPEAAIEEEAIIETTLGNFPNPFNPTTVINYQLAATSQVILKVYDMLGKEVATLVNETKPAGSYNVSFNGANLPSGVYVCSLQTNDQVINQKMLLMK